MHVGKTNSCHADHQEVSRCRTRGEYEESIECRQESTQGRDPQDRCHQKSKTRVSVAPQKGLVSPEQFKIFKKKVRYTRLIYIALIFDAEWS